MQLRRPNDRLRHHRHSCTHFAASMPSEHAPFDLLIFGGTVIDGTNRPRFNADVGITGDRIVALGDLGGHAARQRVDAREKIVAPGFIDAHTHDDEVLLSQPAMAPKISQGVTTVVTGNCGISLAPLQPTTAMPPPLNLLGGEHNFRFPTFAAYLDALDRRPAAVNVAAMVGHTALRVRTMPSLDRAANEREVAAMQVLLREALGAGAIGISTGTYYLPAAHASTEEIIEVCRPLTGSTALYATHMRNEGDRIMESLDETFRIGRELDVPVVISHHKVAGPANWGRSQATLARIGQAMQCQCVSLDCYPYHANSTVLRTDNDLLQRRILIASSEPHPEFAGRYLTDIAAELGTSLEEAADRLQPASAIYFSMDEKDVCNILSFSETMIGSDGLPVGEKPHPRLWGTFPRVLGHYSRDLKLFPLETAVWKMTGLTARNFGLHERGTLAPGKHADVVVFDAGTVCDKATYEAPVQPSEGIDLVVVNGAITWDKGVHSGARKGQVIRRRA
jgi:N-acyl-D-amino-acid deacylase